MPSLRILTWNSTGEDPHKANELLNEINFLNAAHPQAGVHIILNQEAQQAAGGAICAMLDNPGIGGIGGNYNRPSRRTSELIGGGGAGYTVLTHATLPVLTPLPHNYGADQAFIGWLHGLYPGQRQTAQYEVGRWRPPVCMDFHYQNRGVRLITWHAPLDASGLLQGCTTPRGGAPLDAFLFLDRSGLLHPGPAVDIVVVAGDLNMTALNLKTRCCGYEPLPGFAGVTSASGLDHIIACRPGPGRRTVDFHEARSVRSASVHDIFSCRLSWN